MLCDNCGKREANVMYSENINGVKKELHLCDICSQKLGIGEMQFSIPTDFSSLFGEFMGELGTTEFKPLFQELEILSCNQCGFTFEDIINNGKLGCGNCYEVFGDKINPILKRIQGNVQHVGRIGKINPNKLKDKNVYETTDGNRKDKKNNSEERKIQKLQEELKLAIKEERYEDAAKIRDELKKKE